MPTCYSAGSIKKQGNRPEAERVYDKGFAADGVSNQYKIAMKARLNALKPYHMKK
jgi:hypothetical protein